MPDLLHLCLHLAYEILVKVWTQAALTSVLLQARDLQFICELLHHQVVDLLFGLYFLELVNQDIITLFSLFDQFAADLLLPPLVLAGEELHEILQFTLDLLDFVLLLEFLLFLLDLGQEFGYFDEVLVVLVMCTDKLSLGVID